MASILKPGKNLQQLDRHLTRRLVLHGILGSNEYFYTNVIIFISINLMEIIYDILQGIRKRAQAIQKHNDCLHLLSRGGYDLLEKKLLDDKKSMTYESICCVMELRRIIQHGYGMVN